MKKLIATAIVTGLLVLGGASAVQAAPAAPMGLCPGGRVVYKSTVSTPVFKEATGAQSSVTGSSGVTLTISRSTTFTVTGSQTLTAGISGSVIVATVKLDQGITLGMSFSGTSTSSGSWKVPASYNTGKLSIGSLKYSGTVKKYIENTACTLVPQSGVATFNQPEKAWSFKHFKIN